ncbi:Uncharacterised protein [Bacteroides heparinolyticus]|uniref:Uncharacterized protein n=1 Tax=Prevotella heparinolytica TaxID=28113 RepID=A0A449I275_9BACE|nr:hypothetical protein [Bacteroides heparinolyticus]VFB13565.1 Uncharacterised protein [Bacteroides heparinolyticus]
MKDLFKSGIIILFFYFVFTSVCGIIRIELFLPYIDKEILGITRLSSYINLFISEVIAITFIGALLGGCYFILSLLKNAPSNATHLLAIKAFITIYALNEFSKLVALMWILEIQKPDIVHTVEDVNNFFQDNNWFFISNIIDCITFLSASICYNFILILKNEKKFLLDAIIVMLFLITIFVLTHLDLVDML